MNTKKTSFSAVVKLPERYDCEEVTIDIELDKDEEHLTYDEVEDAIYKNIDEQYHYSSSIDDSNIDDDSLFPEIISIVINSDDGESYPVISESMDDSELKKDGAFTKYLVLPDAVYSLTPECALWMEMKNSGIIDEDAPFDFAAYHKLVEKANR